MKANIKGSVNLLSKNKPPNDDHGHGTHVAGIIGALDNEFVVVAGVTVVAAAGNSAFEALYFTPANCPDSLTVSAFVDLNGSAGGNGSVTINGVLEYEETFANSFSNYSDFCWDLNGDGQCTDADTLVVNLMALGVKIFSTLPTSPVTLNDPTGADKELNYDTLTGTSMATPHVAGAAALYLKANPLATPAQVRAALTTGGACPGGGTGGHITCPAPWPDDFDSAWKPLLDVAPPEVL